MGVCGLILVIVVLVVGGFIIACGDSRVRGY